MKYEFASPAWCAAMHGLIAERVATEVKTKPDLALSICEVFTNAPPHMADADGKVAWSCVVDGANIDFRPSERDDVRFKVVGDYAAILPLGQYETRGEPDRARELAAMAAKVRESGAMTTITSGAPAKPDAQPLTSVHDAIARLTL
jgi:hypothetical protein